MAESRSRILSEHGVDIRAVISCDDPSDTRTFGNTRPGPVSIRSLRWSGAQSLNLTEPNQSVWWESRVIHVDFAPNCCWAANSVGNVPWTETSTELGVTVEIPAAACPWSVGPTSAVLLVPA